MKEVTLSLPEWSFLDATSHLGNPLENRDILQHIPSFTIMEILFMEGNEFLMDKEVITRRFSYINLLGAEEDYLMVVHISLAPPEEVQEILDKAIEFYMKYLEWDDNNAVQENISKHN